MSVAEFTPPEAAGQTKSIPTAGDPEVKIFVTNKTGRDLEVHWVNDNGMESSPPKVISAGAEKYEMGDSYPGHLYRFKIKGELIHTWAIRKDQPHLIIESPAAGGLQSEKQSRP